MDTPIVDLLIHMGSQIRARRLALNLTQADAAAKSGVAYRTWRRMEKEGSASIEDLIRAAIVLRCEQGLDTLFPKPAANSMDELLKAQRAAAKRTLRQTAQKAQK